MKGMALILYFAAAHPRCARTDCQRHEESGRSGEPGASQGAVNRCQLIHRTGSGS